MTDSSVPHSAPVPVPTPFCILDVVNMIVEGTCCCCCCCCSPPSCILSDYTMNDHSFKPTVVEMIGAIAPLLENILRICLPKRAKLEGVSLSELYT